MPLRAACEEPRGTSSQRVGRRRPEFEAESIAIVIHIFCLRSCMTARDNTPTVGPPRHRWTDACLCTSEGFRREARAAAASRTRVRRCKEVLPAAALDTGRVRHRGGGLYREPTTQPRCRRAPRPGLSHQIHRKEAPRLSTPDDPKSAQLDCSTDVFVRYSG